MFACSIISILVAFTWVFRMFAYAIFIAFIQAFKMFACTIFIVFSIIFITKIYLAQMPGSKISRLIESEAHKKLISRTFRIKLRC